MLQSGNRRIFAALILLFCASLYGRDFVVASYNPENVFDMVKNGSEYEDYTPNSKYGWNEKSYEVKIQNVVKVLSDLNADVVGLVEIENRAVLKELSDRLAKKGQKYFYEISASDDSAVNCAILSKFPIKNKNQIQTGKKNSRDILEVWLDVDGVEFIIFVNHWQSKRKPESHRMRYAKALKKRLDEIGDKEFVVLGDLNSNFNEMDTFINDKKLNDTKGKTGINHILKTIKNERLTKESDLKDGDFLYNLWLEIDPKSRFSHLFFGEKGTIDNILIPQALQDQKRIDYIDGSFAKFDPPYLFKDGEIYRWEMKKTFFGTKADGFSDHLPVYAKFKTIK